MSAFGRRPGTAGRPAFGVAKPMQGGPGAAGGSQFPAIDTAPPANDASPAAVAPEMDAMDRRNARSPAEAMEPEKSHGFGTRVHKLKEHDRTSRGEGKSGS